MHYKNTPTVVVCVVPVEGNKLLLIRRSDTKKLALPGGYHMMGETWQEAGVREVQEETGISLSKDLLTVESVKTANNKNLLFAKYAGPIDVSELEHMTPQIEEVDEIVIADSLPAESDVSFPLHYEVIERYFYGVRF